METEPRSFFDDINSVFTASIHGDADFEYPYFWRYADEKGQAVGTNHNFAFVKSL